VTRWADATGGQGGRDYAARFDALAAAGTDVHGEANLCAALVPAGSRVLDAGCGTGVDPSMLAVARERAPDLPWVAADLSTLDLLAAGHPAYDLVVMAGNVVPLVAAGTERMSVLRAAAHVAPGGLLVAGFGLDRAHLPTAAGLVDLTDYDDWCAEAGLEHVRRLATWDGEPYDGGGYAVSIHARPADGPTAAG